MTIEPTPHNYHDLVAELAETDGTAHVDQWLLGTVARRNALPPSARARLAPLTAAHREAFAATRRAA